MVDVGTVILLLFIMFIGLGLGATTTKEDFVVALRTPKAVLIGLTSQYFFMPLVAFAFAQAFSVKDEYAIGMILIGCSPGGTTSNMFTYWTRGNVALSITMSFCSTLAALGMLPLLIFLLIKTIIDAHIEVPWDNIIIALVLIVIPSFIGLIIRHQNTEYTIGGKYLWQWLELIASVLGALFLLLALIFYIATNYRQIFNAPASLWISAILMEPLGAFFGYGFARYLELKRKDCRTIALETGIQNVTLAIAVVVLSFDGDEQDEVVLFPLLYGICYVVNSAWMVLFLRVYVAPLDDAADDIDDAKTSGEATEVPTKDTEDGVNEESVELQEKTGAVEIV